MNDIELAKLVTELREDIQAAALSAKELGDLEAYRALRAVSTGQVLRV